MKAEVKYYSTDKMYRVNNNNWQLSKKIEMYVLMLISSIVLILGIVLFINGLAINSRKVAVEYSENGKADYTVYLKKNNYYDQKYLTSGMQYVASLINTINADFNYEIHADENMQYEYRYRIDGNLQIMDRDNPEKILYDKVYELKAEHKNSIESNNLVINDGTIIDYDEYNNYVNSYKKEYGLTVDSQLVLTMYVNVIGKHEDGDELLEKNSKLEIVVPLSEQTVDIKINTIPINNSGDLKEENNGLIKDVNKFLMGSILTIVAVVGLITSIKLYQKYRHENIYTLTVKKILREYDQLIVNGKVSIKEEEYKNIIEPETFEEMVDASENLKAPILYYEVIPGEKCFFVLVKEDTLYKYRLTKAYLEREEQEKKNNK